MGGAAAPGAPYHRGLPSLLGDLAIPSVTKLLALYDGIYLGVSGGWDRAIPNPLPGLLPPVQGARRISGAPSNNKGWKKRFFFVSCSQEWGFSIGWAFQTIDNTSPSLSAGEIVDVDQLRGILSSSRAIREMTEDWMIEAEDLGRIIVSGSGSPSEEDEDLGPEDAFGPGCWHERRPGIARCHLPRRGLGKSKWEGIVDGDPSRRVLERSTVDTGTMSRLLSGRR
ncbi:hypothetical protein C4D60_Mb05t17860 [Musa balbisiana]|uniref:Uncharacterized protein n=1 Tax=Musa balbisiana TaxID=52838 RepID=A0A4S8JWX4_MUSBA|nr:hypothetical protein C4D60_Mb05t17860 [Musa balbisiana]